MYELNNSVSLVGSCNYLNLAEKLKIKQMNERLSSDNLYHFTREFETIKLILQNGFRYSLINEYRPHSIIPGTQLIQQNYIVCFCDIKPEENQYHKSCYGNFSIGLNKTWGIKKGIEPVQYIHENSFFTNPKSVSMRNEARGLFQKSQKLNTYDLLAKELIYWSFWRDDHNVIEKKIKEDYDEIIEALKESKKDKILNDFILKIEIRLEEVYEYIEKIDPYKRNYMEDFICPTSNKNIPNKILYDEREWRSCITNFSDKDIVKEKIQNNIVMKGYLSEKHNLRFTDKDLIEIKLDNQKSKDLLYKFLRENKTNLEINLTMDKVNLMS